MGSLSLGLLVQGGASASIAVAAIAYVVKFQSTFTERLENSKDRLVQQVFEAEAEKLRLQAHAATGRPHVVVHPRSRAQAAARTPVVVTRTTPAEPITADPPRFHRLRKALYPEGMFQRYVSKASRRALDEADRQTAAAGGRPNPSGTTW